MKICAHIHPGFTCGMSYSVARLHVQPFAATTGKRLGSCGNRKQPSLSVQRRRFGAVQQHHSISMTVKGVIFDKDGTLFDFNSSWGAWGRGVISAEAGGDPKLLSQLAEILCFDLDKDIFRPESAVVAETAEAVLDLMLSVLPGVDRSSLMERMNEAAVRTRQVEAVPLKPLMSALKNRGIVIGLATNDVEHSARKHLEQAEISDAFSFISGCDSGHGEKPGPGQILAFLQATQLGPEECVMVGDSTHDLRAGRAAGVRTVGVLTGASVRETLTPFADVILPSISELLDWMDSLKVQHEPELNTSKA